MSSCFKALKSQFEIPYTLLHLLNTFVKHKFNVMTGNYNARLSSSTNNTHSQRPEHGGMRKVEMKRQGKF